ENDHVAGGTSTDGTWSHTFCNVSGGQTCPANQIGEVTQNIKALLPNTYTPPIFDMHFDSAPTVYVAKPTAAPPTAAQIREFERKLAPATGIDPYVDPSSPRDVVLFIANTVDQKEKDMVNADPRPRPHV